MAKFLPDALSVNKLLLQVHMAVYPWQERLFTSRASMVLLNCSRQAGKSTCVAFLALLEALTIQEHLVLIVSRSARQSRLLLRKVRDFMARMPLKAVQRAQASAEQIVFPNLSRIVALPCKEETIRGYSSVGLLIIDEAARVPDELYQAVRPMLAASDGRLICLSTPYGRVGFFHDAWTSDTQEWERISVRGVPLSEHLSYLPRRVKWFCDPAGANERAEMIRAGHQALPGRNDIRAGIARLREWLALGLVRIAPGACPNLLEEAQRYKYDTDPRHSRSELPVDEYNHGLAGLRYLVMGLPRPKAPVNGDKAPTPQDKQAAEIRARRRYLWNTADVWTKI